jgi:hypothetical protein
MMTKQIFERTSGDTGPPIQDNLIGGVDNLSNVTLIVAYLRRKRETTGVCPVAIKDTLTKEIETDLSAWLPTARNGDWRIKYKVTFASGDQWTWESGRADVVRVGPNYEP